MDTMLSSFRHTTNTWEGKGRELRRTPMESAIPKVELELETTTT